MTAIVMLGVGMAAMGGAFFAPITIVHPAMGAEIITVAFVVVVIGGPRQFLGRGDRGAAGRRGARHHHSFRPRRRRSIDLRPDVPGAAGAAARAARRAHREIRMKSASPSENTGRCCSRASRWSRCRSPCGCSASRSNTGTMVVTLAIATMGLNLCVGYTGLVSFGHGTWFGIGAYAAGLIQLHWFGGEIWLPLLLSMVLVADPVRGRRHRHPAPPRRLLLAADAGAGRAHLHHRVPLERSDRRRRWPRRPEARQHRAASASTMRWPITSSSR